MTEEKDLKRMDALFYSLVVSLSHAAFMQLGKVANPVSGKVERNLEQAKLDIDMVEMLMTKTKGNLSGEEEKMIKAVLSDLQLNYVDEMNKPSGEADIKEEEKKIITPEKKIIIP